VRCGKTKERKVSIVWQFTQGTVGSVRAGTRVLCLPFVRAGTYPALGTCSGSGHCQRALREEM
jgi:hypothetical protein